MTEKIETRCNLSEKVIPIWSLDVCLYIDEDGRRRYSHTFRGDAPTWEVSGVLSDLKFDLYHYSAHDQMMSEDEDDDDFL